MCTQYSVPTHRLLDLLSCLLRLVDQVQQDPGRPRAPLLTNSRVPRTLLLLLGFLVGVPFSVDQSLSYFRSLSVASAAMLTTFSSFLMLSTVTTVIMLCL